MTNESDAPVARPDLDDDVHWVEHALRSDARSLGISFTDRVWRILAALAAERARADQAYRNGWLAAAKAVDEYGNYIDAADFSVRNTWEIRDHLIEFAPEAE